MSLLTGLGTQTATTATERRTTQLFVGVRETSPRSQKSVMSKRQWRRSAPSDNTFTRNRKTRVEPSIYQLPQKSLASLDVGKPTLMTANKRKIENRQVCSRIFDAQK
jgi:hypothetical protein